MILKIILGFILIAFIETLNGIFRIKVLNKSFSKRLSKFISFILGSILIFLINLFYIPILGISSQEEAFFIGFTWALLMILYDVFVGKFMFKMSWENIADDFDILKGNLLSLGIILIVFMPIFVFKYF
ncbi:hypothetical protein ACH5BK_10085 [Arcobacter sp. YIC-80]|uniref:hypothetical protein n=1 Tax=Arcobacter sp. YIC-80 TaxID=3376683 RepID=UPI00384A81C7